LSTLTTPNRSSSGTERWSGGDLRVDGVTVGIRVGVPPGVRPRVRIGIV